ncbi:hypothetical protein [Methylobacterium sp. GC_Met_2]|uniref:hypothetical protein n=1 Tax=Methylobacterium sp. GC_Met_2 TaxID=2937376 RepID=UPI00226B03B9|nr:hypothetical protein [Methylobacterium sp. GC_Met_2]
MLKTLKALLGLAQREDATSDELNPSLPAAQAELAAAREAQAAAEQAYRGSLLGGNEAETLRLDAARREASVRIDRATALIEALRERLAEARDREAEAERVAEYEAARVQADDARRALAEHYDSMATDLVRLMEVVARAEMELQRVNADLPRGAERIQSVEHTVRDIPAGPDEVLSETEVELWVEVGQTTPGTFDQDNVYKTGPGRGVIKIRGIPLTECIQVELRKFTEQQVLLGSSRQVVFPLHSRISLPGFRAGEPAIWKAMDALAKPSEIVKRIENLRFGLLPEPVEAAPTPTKPRRKLIAEPGAQPVQALPKSPPTREYRGPFGGPENDPGDAKRVELA